METLLWNLLDLTLAAMLFGLGWAAVASPNLRQGVVLFIAFGLLLAVAWARLRAPDLALAEAAIGAGLSGALLLAALRDEPDAKRKSSMPTGSVVWSTGLLALLLAGLFGWALLAALSTADPGRLSESVLANLAKSGVSNPVTAVLLNFRAYDTLLELAVLLAAVLGIFSLGTERSNSAGGSPVLAGLIRWLVPLLIVTAGYLLWVGAHAPGGAFQAGSLLAAAAVLLRLSGHAGSGLPGPLVQRWLLVSGVGVFLTVGLAVTAGGLAFLEYPRPWSGVLILWIEVAATLAIAVTLALAFLGGRPAGWDAPPSSSSAERKERTRCN